MPIHIENLGLEARLQCQAKTLGSSSLEDVLARLVETQEEQNRWLLDHRAAIEASIEEGIAELDRGEGILR